MNADARKSMEDLFVRYAEGVSRHVRLRVGDAELAEEITARIFLTATRHVHQQHGSALAWRPRSGTRCWPVSTPCRCCAIVASWTVS
ncbi:MAG TPA: hypothetical protein VFE62_27845 [Gemmataceae bacterium]|nr:hypothetical protein [Gemmataceae bacterium]